MDENDKLLWLQSASCLLILHENLHLISSGKKLRSKHQHYLQEDIHAHQNFLFETSGESVL